MNYKEYIIDFQGVQMVQTSHAYDRSLRKGDMDAEDLRDFLRGICWFFKIFKREILKDFGYNGEIFYYSDYYKRGCIVAARYDSKDEDEKLILALITIYPEGANVPMQKDTPKLTVDKTWKRLDGTCGLMYRGKPV
jgi:hypothetical protein